MKPQGLGKRAEALWDGVLEQHELDSAGLAILEDACRTVDIVDRLSGALKSKNQEWMRLSEEAEYLSNGAAEIHIVVNPLLGEIRQQRMTLRSLLAQLKLGVSKEKAQNKRDKTILEKLEEEFDSR